MNAELIDLIKLALADGVVTEKERNIIIKKGISYGIDEDEIGMIIDAEIFKFQSSTNVSSTEKNEKILKCPSCGNLISGLSKNCICGYIINSNSFKEESLEESIENLENLIVKVRSVNIYITPKEEIDNLIAKVDKEIRFLRTRYSQNPDINKLLVELELLSSKYIGKKVKERRNIFLVTGFIFSFCFLFIGYQYNKKVILNKSQNHANSQIDSITNLSLKSKYKKSGYLYLNNWDDFEKEFYNDYPKYNHGYIPYCKEVYRFNEQLSGEIAKNQFELIKKNFKNPLDFVLFDDKNNYRNLESTKKSDSLYIVTKIISPKLLISKREVDKKIDLIENSDLKSVLIETNGGDSLSLNILTKWNDTVIKFILETN